ncbi:cysteine desulfurase family protein [Spirochaeta cellobiosiphila]|uniref:cysteine desulfurase family protein n=1 Tax=Spirochaeta cellobiosiphila TaxID=504483 RepID=UPI0003F81A0A|nr:cysteine desulfurase family protein [Spirochaeta cellobiosiphila]
MNYFDWAAAAKFDIDTFQNISDQLTSLAYNPSAQYKLGKESLARLEEARQLISHALKAQKGRIIFTSGGTESNNMVFQSLLTKVSPGRVLMSSIEHPSVYNTKQYLSKSGIPVDIIKPDHRGVITPDILKSHIKEDTKVVSIMALHNETGVIQPIKELVQTVRNMPKGNNILFHTDAVQVLGKSDIDLADWGVDAASFSGHKVGALRGIGLLYLKKDLDIPQKGGGQEEGYRSGTENVVGAYHLAQILKKGIWQNKVDLSQFYEELRKQLRCRSLPVERGEYTDLFSPFILNVSFDKIPGEVLVRVMGDKGYALASGSACSSKKKEKTRAIESMGIEKNTAFNSIRISIGYDTTQEELDELQQALIEEVAFLQSQL